MIGRYGVGYKPPTYHDIREKLLKQVVDKTDIELEEYNDEWKRTGCTIMSNGWTDKKRRSICNFLVNSRKGTVFLYSLDTPDISKTADKIFKMLDDAVEFVMANSWSSSRNHDQGCESYVLKCARSSLELW